MSSSSTAVVQFSDQKQPAQKISRLTEFNEYLLKSYTKLVSKLKHQDQSNDELHLSNKHIIGGGLIGIAFSALVRWNMGKYSRLGIYRKRWVLARNFIMINRKPQFYQVFTNYYVPILDNAANNFMCYSGQAGIGKSTHFMNMAYSQSTRRPTIYLSFKFSGKDHNTFEQDISQQLGYGDNGPQILTQIIRVTKKIHQINTYPHIFWLKQVIINLLMGCLAYKTATSNIDIVYGVPMFSVIGISYIGYINFMYPFIIQSLRRTCPLIIFDDLNKIQQLNMFPQIVRFLQILQNGMANVILISPDEDTWTKLRREPGVKDRLRVRQIFYNHIYTAETLLKYIADDKNFENYMKYINGNKLYSKELVMNLVKQLIGKRQVTLRRFTSILILNDEQQYMKLVQVLKNYEQTSISIGQTCQQFTDILYESQAKTMVSNLKSIKRQLKITQQQYMDHLHFLLGKQVLPSDNVIAPHLKAYNIVRDMQSDYIFNGRFMFTIFNIAIKQYEKDLKQYKEDSVKETQVLEPSVVLTDNHENKIQSKQQAIKQQTKSQINEQVDQSKANVKEWNSSNTVKNS